MKSVCLRCLVAALLACLFVCQGQKVFAEGEKEIVGKEVKAQFEQLVTAINQVKAGAWAGYYSKDGFVSAIAGTDYYDTRVGWVDAVSKYFSLRERQRVEPLAVRVTALSSDLALMTSDEKSEMWMKDGKNIKARHVFTMVWKKEKDGWRIIHSHESWAEEPVR